MENNENKEKVILIGFDGVLHKGMQSDALGDMVPGSDEAVKVLKDNGWKVYICTSREVNDDLKNWLKEKGIGYDGINESKVKTDIILSDKAMRFNGEWNWLMNNIADFETWQEREKKDEDSKKLEKSYKEGALWKAERDGDKELAKKLRKELGYGKTENSEDSPKECNMFGL